MLLRNGSVDSKMSCSRSCKASLFFSKKPVFKKEICYFEVIWSWYRAGDRWLFYTNKNFMAQHECKQSLMCLFSA